MNAICNACGQPFAYDEHVSTGKLWDFLKLASKNVGLLSNVPGDEPYATCASCCLSLERDRLNRRGSVEIGAQP